MYTANRVFELQHSRFSVVLQLLFFIFIVALSYSLLILSIWLLSLLFMAITWRLFLRQPQVKRFEYLEHQDWSFEFYDSSLKIQRRQITKILDHQAYIALYFSDSKYKICIVWWDQLSHSQWKKLKLLAKLA
jgi:hypothetical protein